MMNPILNFHGSNNNYNNNSHNMMIPPAPQQQQQQQQQSATGNLHQIRFIPPSNRAEKRILIFLLVVRTLVENFYRNNNNNNSNSNGNIVGGDPFVISMPLDQLIDLLHQQLETALLGFPSVSSFSKTDIIEILHELERTFSIGKLVDYSTKNGENFASSTAGRANYYETVFSKFQQDQTLDLSSLLTNNRPPPVLSSVLSLPSNNNMATTTTDLLVPKFLEYTVNPWRSGLTDLTPTSPFHEIALQRLIPLIPPQLRSPLQFDSQKMKFFYETLQRATDSGVSSPNDVLSLRPIVPPILGNSNSSIIAGSSSSSSSSSSNENFLIQIDSELASQSGGVFLPEKDLMLGLIQRHRHAPHVAASAVNELVRQGKLVKFEYVLGAISNNVHNENNNNSTASSSSISALKCFSPLIGISSLVNSNNSNSFNNHNNKKPITFTPSKFPTFVSRPLYDRFSLPSAFQCALYIYRILGSSSAMLKSDVVSCLQQLGWKNNAVVNALIDFLSTSSRLKLLVSFSIPVVGVNNNHNQEQQFLQYLAISQEAKDLFEKSRREALEKQLLQESSSTVIVQLRDASAVEFYNDLKKALTAGGVSGWPKDYLIRLMKVKFNWSEPELEARYFPLLKSYGLIQLVFDETAKCFNVTISNYNTQVVLAADVALQSLSSSASNNTNNNNNSYNSLPPAVASLKTATKVYFENLRDLLPPAGLEKSSVMVLMNHKHGWKEDRTQLEFLGELVAKNLIHEIRDPTNPAMVKLVLAAVPSASSSSSLPPILSLDQDVAVPAPTAAAAVPEVNGNGSPKLTLENSPLLKIISTCAPTFYSKLATDQKCMLFLVEFFKMAAELLFGPTAQKKLAAEEENEIEETVSFIVHQLAYSGNNNNNKNKTKNRITIQKAALFLWIADNVETIRGKTEREEVLNSLINKYSILTTENNNNNKVNDGSIWFHPDFVACFNSTVTKEDVESDFNTSSLEPTNNNKKTPSSSSSPAFTFSYFEDHYLKMIDSAPKATAEVRPTQAKFLVNFFRFASIGKRHGERLTANSLKVQKDSFTKWLITDMQKKQNIVRNQRDFDDLTNVLVKNGYLLVVFGGGKQLITVNPSFFNKMKPELLCVPLKPTTPTPNISTNNNKSNLTNGGSKSDNNKTITNTSPPEQRISGQRRSRSPPQNKSAIITTNSNTSSSSSSTVPPPRPPHQNPVLHVDASNYHLYNQQDEDDFFSSDDASFHHRQNLAIPQQQIFPVPPPPTISTFHQPNFTPLPPSTLLNNNGNTNNNFISIPPQQQQRQQEFHSSFIDQAFVQEDGDVVVKEEVTGVDSTNNNNQLLSLGEDILKRVKLPWPHRNPISFPPPLKVVAGVPYFRSKEIYPRLMWGPPPFVAK